MASKAFVETVLNRLEAAVRQPLVEAFRHVLDNLRFGALANKERAENFQGYGFTATTSTTANEEFSIQHGMGQAPYLAFPVMRLDSTGEQVVRLRVTRAADVQRLYLSSPDTNAAIRIYAEF